MYRVLVADDCKFIRDRLTKYLSQHGYEVLQAEDGEEAVRACLFKRPDIVLLDIVMPGKSGLEALKDIHTVNPAIKVIIVSALGHEGILDEALRLGAVNFMLKPVTPNQVTKAIEHALGVCHQTTEHSFPSLKAGAIQSAIA
ncbi:MAG: response regulator [Thermoflexales bacterium]|nr:response regulator [Thermoflexales bacterium]